MVTRCWVPARYEYNFHGIGPKTLFFGVGGPLRWKLCSWLAGLRCWCAVVSRRVVLASLARRSSTIGKRGVALGGIEGWRSSTIGKRGIALGGIERVALLDSRGGGRAGRYRGVVLLDERRGGAWRYRRVALPAVGKGIALGGSKVRSSTIEGGALGGGLMHS